MRNLLLASVSIACGLVLAGTANARPARIDIAPESGGGAFSGEFWAVDHNFSSPAATFTDDDPIAFLLNIGAGAQQYNFCFAANGYVSITSSCSSAVPSSDYIKAFNPALTWTLMQWSTGKIDTTGTPGTYSATAPGNDAVNAMRFTWRKNDDGSTGSNTTIGQVVLLDRGNGDFDVEFNYGLFDDSPNYSPSLSPGFKLGGSQYFATDQLVGSFTCEFRGGVNVSSSCGASPVPLPAPAVLLGSGLAALWRFQRRRKGVVAA